MADTKRGGNTGYAMENSAVRDGGERLHGDDSHHVSQPLTEQQEEELWWRTDQVLCTPITGKTPEEITLENARLTNLVERERLERLQ
ncbi:hypothetical protein D1007_18366 [Hordeum vulgare]|nr:hypothetical protein D1007_18366 [Hordeum vulgare]